MRALVTGGLGFIGSFMTETLVARGYEVTVVDDQRASVVELEDVEAEVIPDDVATFLKHYRRATLGDVVIHCASPVGSAGVLPYRGRIVSEIVNDTAGLIEACTDADVPLVNISTSEVYGFSGVYRETDDCRVPVRPSARLEYAVGKLAGEFAVMNSIDRGLRAISVRPFNVAGPRQTSAKGFVLPTFAEQALAGLPLTVFGDGGQRRAFTAVWDLCRFICDYIIPRGPWDGTVYNVANPHNETTILKLAERMQEDRAGITFTTGKVVFGSDYEEAEGRVKVPDIARAASLGWRPEVDLDELIELTLAHYREEIPA